MPVCFLPDGLDYEVRAKVVAAGPDDGEYGMRVTLQSLDPETDMPVIEILENAGGSVKIVWEVTSKSETAIEGHTFATGDQINLDALLVKSGDCWLIDGM